MSLYETVILGSMKEEIIKNKGSNIALNLKQIQTKIEIPLASGAGYIRIGGEKKNMRGPLSAWLVKHVKHGLVLEIIMNKIITILKDFQSKLS